MLPTLAGHSSDVASMSTNTQSAKSWSIIQPPEYARQCNIILQYTWSSSPTLGSSWRTGLPPCQSGLVWGTGVCLRRSHILELYLTVSRTLILLCKHSNAISRPSYFPHTSTFSAFEVLTKMRYINPLLLLLLHWNEALYICHRLLDCPLTLSIVVDCVWSICGECVNKLDWYACSPGGRAYCYA